MARLIDVDKADVDSIRCYYSGHCYLEDVQEWIDDQPTVDAVPVVHGRWEKRGKHDWYCTACKIGVPYSYTGHKYCPNCGADMRGDTE